MNRFTSIGTLLLGLAALTYHFTNTASSTLRGTDRDHDLVHQEQRKLSDVFFDPKTVIDKEKNCQIVYILGVEGAMHHGFSTVFDTLARQQVDPATNMPYVVHRGGMEGDETFLQSVLLGISKRHRDRLPHDPRLVQEAIRRYCPNDGKKHIILEDSSFPFGQADFDFPRVRRDPAWISASTMDEIASSESALHHPTNLYNFYNAFSPYADIRFVAIHRPFLETIASHPTWDGGSIGHSNVIRGFMLLLRRFLDSHTYDATTGQKLWTLVCIERIAAKFYNSQLEVDMARQHILSNLANFLSWPIEDCPTCFDSWVESSKDYRDVLGEDLEVLEDDKKTLEGVWPPVVEDSIAEQSQCQI